MNSYRDEEVQRHHLLDIIAGQVFTGKVLHYRKPCGVRYRGHSSCILRSLEERCLRILHVIEISFQIYMPIRKVQLFRCTLWQVVDFARVPWRRMDDGISVSYAANQQPRLQEWPLAGVEKALPTLRYSGKALQVSSQRWRRRVDGVAEEQRQLEEKCWSETFPCRVKSDGTLCNPIRE